MGVFGESEEGHAHQFGEFYKLGVVSEVEASAWLVEWHRKAPLHAIFCDGNEGTLIATINATFRREFGITTAICHAANKERKTGIGHVYGRLFARTFTIGRNCNRHRQEYHEYRWAKVRRGQQEWATSTPEGHHGDGMDETRYALVGLAKGFLHHPVDLQQVQPQWSRMERQKSPVEAVPGGGVRDTLAVAVEKRRRPKMRQPNWRGRVSTGTRAVRGFGGMGLRG